MKYSHELKIPKERIAVLIGREGETKKQIEQETKTKLQIDSKEGDIKISGEDSIDLFVAKEMIKAIGRGFNPDVARLILKADYVFEVLQISDYVGKSKKSALRLKGRVIGEDGKARKRIEEMTETFICIYGKTISIIGRAENAAIARRAIESLLAGSTHISMYKWLNKRMKEMEREKVMEDRIPDELKKMEKKDDELDN